eukprot:TRINITY_DN3300_c0_g1_i1.p1 TRINITY_DN3300_c0_g1~~TRINITY_DN3300_c0_g1_i1.p1  ORF type:complete len:506 (-),score=121.04 TRINITY_DN3300_c0_g1_i1:13-1530(-)
MATVVDAIYLTERTFITWVVGLTGTPEDQVKGFLVMLLCFPLSFLLKYLPNNPNLKHGYNIILGLGSCLYTLGPFQWMHSFFTTLVTYLIMSSLSPKVSHKYVFGFIFGYMTLAHIYRMYVDYLAWTMDFSSPQMMLTLKLTALAWSYHDGVAPDGELLIEHSKRKITRLPSLLELYGYVYFFPTFFSGPPIEIHDYLSYINLSRFKESPAGKGKIPSTIEPFLWCLAKAFGVLPFVVLSGMYTPREMLTPEWNTLPLWYKLGKMHILASLCRFKYYFAWSMSETACVASGMSFNGVDKEGKAKWDRCTNVIITKIEFGQNIRDFSTYWNIYTSAWLKNYVYTRIKHKNPMVPTLATYLTSAFWHGFYPGYYFFFMGIGFLTEAAREARRKLRPYFVTEDDKPIQPGKLYYDIASCLISEFMLTYYGIAFVLLSWTEAMKAWATVYYIGNILTVVLFVVIKYVVPTPKKSIKQKATPTTNTTAPLPPPHTSPFVIPPPSSSKKEL